MKQFSDRVKRANRTIKTLPYEERQVSDKDRSSRSKAIEYSKSIPKPVRRGTKLAVDPKESNEIRVLNELARLEIEYQRHKERMRAVAAEMQRRGI